MESGVLPRTDKSFAHAIRIRVTQTVSGAYSTHYGIVSRLASACLEAPEVVWEWSDIVGVGQELGHTDPRSLVQNLHGIARLVWQERGSRIGTCQTLC